MNKFRNHILKAVFLVIITTTSLILGSIIAYAPLSIYPAGEDYGNPANGIRTECPDFSDQGGSSCEIVARPCSVEGQYKMTVWADNDKKTKNAYYINYDEDERSCRDVDCGDGDWNSGAGSGKKCCGDDYGVAFDNWHLVVRINEEGIPVEKQVDVLTNVTMDYTAGSQILSKQFDIQEDQVVEYMFYVENCYLIETEMHARIYDDQGRTITGPDPARTGPDNGYIYYANESIPCVTTADVIDGSFNAEAGRTYTIELYKGNTNEGEYGSFGEPGFDELILGASYSYTEMGTKDEVREESVEFSDSGEYTVHIDPTSFGEQGSGTLDASTVSVNIVPSDYVSLDDVGNIVNPDGSIDVFADINVNSDAKGSGADCARVQSGVLCFDDPRQDWQWLDAGDVQGAIYDVPCLGKSLVSDGNNWYGCNVKNIDSPDASPGYYSRANSYFELGRDVHEIRNHDYACFDTTYRWNLSECCGEDSCHSNQGGVNTGGVMLQTGESIDKSDMRYYCTSYSSLQNDLDDIADEDPTGMSCTSAESPEGMPENFTWTGGYCCGEPDDGEEFYNDLDGDGGCWNSTPVYSGDYVEDNGRIIKEVVNYNGEFYGCAIDSVNYKENNQDLLEITDSHSMSRLVNNADFCEVLPGALGQNAYCSKHEEWEQTSWDGMHLSTAPVTKPVQSECCPGDKCWDGSQCVSSQTGDGSLDTFEGYRCYDGKWVKSELKQNWNSTEVGFCPSPEQCLVEMSGNPANNDMPEMFYTHSGKPVCVNNGQYFLDNFCEKGKWTSRTRQIALTMLDKVKAELGSIDEYTLYCDSYQNALPEYRNMLPEVCERGDMQVPCINNVCILTYEDNIITGMSFNVPIDSSHLGGDEFLGECIDEMESGVNNSFIDCSSGEIWYNPAINSVIFDKYYMSGELYLENENWFTRFKAIFKNKFFSVLKKIQFWQPESEVFGEPTEIKTGFITNESHFDRIYIKYKEGREVVAVAGKAVEVVGNSSSPTDIVKGKFVSVSYKGFTDTDVCEFVEKYDERFHRNYPSAPRGIETAVCEKIGNSYYVFSRDQIGYDIWQDLTSRFHIGNSLGPADGGICDDVECPDYCSGQTLYYSGECSQGFCEYDSRMCPEWCSMGQCVDAPVGDGDTVPDSGEDLDECEFSCEPGVDKYCSDEGQMVYCSQRAQGWSHPEYGYCPYWVYQNCTQGCSEEPEPHCNEETTVVVQTTLENVAGKTPNQACIDSGYAGIASHHTGRPEFAICSRASENSSDLWVPVAYNKFSTGTCGRRYSYCEQAFDSGTFSEIINVTEIGMTCPEEDCPGQEFVNVSDFNMEIGGCEEEYEDCFVCTKMTDGRDTIVELDCIDYS